MKAAGELSSGSTMPNEEVIPIDEIEVAQDSDEDKLKAFATSEEEEETVDLDRYRPRIASDRSWHLSELDLGTYADGYDGSYP